MLIRKLFRFENAHRVRGCSTRRCSHSIHGHSYKIELLLEAHTLDNGQMVYDFGLLKNNVYDLIDAFDHAVSLWSGDDPDYLTTMRKHTERWVLIPVSPSAEQFSRLFFRLVNTTLSLTDMVNGEAGVGLHSVIVHETEAGYAQCFREDADNPRMGMIELREIAFFAAITRSWHDISDMIDCNTSVQILTPGESAKLRNHSSFLRSIDRACCQTVDSHCTNHL